MFAQCHRGDPSVRRSVAGAPVFVLAPILLLKIGSSFGAWALLTFSSSGVIRGAVNLEPNALFHLPRLCVGLAAMLCHPPHFSARANHFGLRQSAIKRPSEHRGGSFAPEGRAGADQT